MESDPKGYHHSSSSWRAAAYKGRLRTEHNTFVGGSSTGSAGQVPPNVSADVPSTARRQGRRHTPVVAPGGVRPAKRRGQIPAESRARQRSAESVSEYP
jgi:hypothetical protein